MPLVTRTTTAGNIIKQDTQPDDKTNGTIWIDTSSDPPTFAVANGTEYGAPRLLVNGTKIPIGAFLS